MTTINIQHEPARNEPSRNEQRYNKSGTHLDASNFSKSMETANNAKSKQTDAEQEDEVEDSSPNDTTILAPELVPVKIIEFDGMQKSLPDLSGDLSQQPSVLGTGVLNNMAVIATPNTQGMTNLTSSPMNMEQLATMMEQIIQQPAKEGQQWKFMLLDNSALKQISLLQVAPGRWSLSFESFSKAQDQQLSKNLGKLSLRLQATGADVEIVQMKEQID